MKKKYYYIIGFLIVILLCSAIMTTCNAFSVKCEDQKECNIVFINNVVIKDTVYLSVEPTYSEKKNK